MPVALSLFLILLFISLRWRLWRLLHVGRLWSAVWGPSRLPSLQLPRGLHFGATSILQSKHIEWVPLQWKFLCMVSSVWKCVNYLSQQSAFAWSGLLFLASPEWRACFFSGALLHVKCCFSRSLDFVTNRKSVYWNSDLSECNFGKRGL